MEWILFITGSVVIIISYIEDYISYMTDKFSLLELFDTTQINVITEYAADYQPVNFAWWIFVTGEVILLVTIYSFFARNKKALKN